jgi:hypothetical protein
VGPLQSGIFDPLRSIFDVAGMNVEGRANSDHDLAGKLAEGSRP